MAAKKCGVVLANPLDGTAGEVGGGARKRSSIEGCQLHGPSYYIFTVFGMFFFCFLVFWFCSFYWGSAKNRVVYYHTKSRDDIFIKKV